MLARHEDLFRPLEAVDAVREVPLVLPDSEVDRGAVDADEIGDVVLGRDRPGDIREHHGVVHVQDLGHELLDKPVELTAVPVHIPVELDLVERGELLDRESGV